MASWPRWGRWGAVALAYGLLGLAFWLMTQDVAWLRLVGLAVFGLAMPLMVHAGRAVMRERSRYADRRYLREFMPAMLIYMALMLYVWPLQKGLPVGWLKGALALSPALPVAWVIVASIRFVLASDELERRQHLEALAIGVSLVCVVSIALGLLAAARLIVVDGTYVLLGVYPAICLVYGITRCVLVRCARAE